MQLKQFFMRIKQRLRGEGEEVCKKELQLRESRVRQTATVAKGEGERQTGRQTRLTGRAATADSEAAKGICLWGMQQGAWEGKGMCGKRGGVVCIAKESQPGTGS